MTRVAALARGFELRVEASKGLRPNIPSQLTVSSQSAMLCKEEVTMLNCWSKVSVEEREIGMDKTPSGVSSTMALGDKGIGGDSGRAPTGLYTYISRSVG